MDEQTRIKEKMAGLVAKWKGKPEPPDKSAEWFRRRVDRSLYLTLKLKLEKLNGGQQTLSSENITETEKIARQIGLIE